LGQSCKPRPVAQVRENPCLQHFFGYHEMRLARRFRKRFDQSAHDEINGVYPFRVGHPIRE